MGFRPVEASKVIADKYKRYLSTIFEIADKDYAKQFIQELAKENTFSSGPYLDVTDSFVKGMSINEMIDKGILPQSFSRLNIPKDRPLYRHQENAIKKVITEKNIVVSTGTGSGKTESFLYPIFRHLINEHENGTLNVGVRALIIYPMNALANDQMERLRDILSEFPEITFGSYTGQTKETYKAAISDYKALNKKSPLNNEIISREQMKDKPPHILITNYSMLEYLMLRPDDSIFFSQNHADKWKYIVLDEAHVYNGSTGIEVSMLLRRLKATLMNDEIRYMLTSATLGSENENADVAEFASGLCDSVFDVDNIIRASRVKPEPEREKRSLGSDFYNSIAGLIEAELPDDEIRTEIVRMTSIEDNFSSLESLLYDLILHDRLYWKIRELMIKPLTIISLSRKLNLTENEVADFVTVATKCDKDNDKLFDARYHMFLRASESVFITLAPSKKLFLTRKKTHLEADDNEYKVFEIGTCTSCHSIYIIGKQEGDYLNQASSFIEAKERVLFLLSDSIQDTDEDHTLEHEKIGAEEYELCSRCGFLHRIGKSDSNRCEHSKDSFIKVIRVNIANDTGRLTKCIACENSSTFSMMRQFFTGQEAVTSVIGTALFEELPSYSFTTEFDEKNGDIGEFGVSIPNKSKVLKAKQFLAFSDSRQAAAYYASYLDQTYKNILYKRLIIEALKNVEMVNIPKFVDKLAYQIESNEILDPPDDDAKKHAWKAILHELVDNNGNTSLKSMGLLSITIEPTGIKDVPKYKLSRDELTSMYSIFSLGMMSDAAIENIAQLTQSEINAYTNGVEYNYTFSDSNPKGYTLSFIPTKSHLNNKRIDYLTRILEKSDIRLSTDEKQKVMESIWKGFFATPDTKLMISNNGKYKLNPDKIMVSQGKKWFKCTRCNKITTHNVKGVCPTYRCEGELKPVSPKELYANNHYFEIFQNLVIRPLRIKEHTAQLNKEQAYDYQRKFKEKELDVLSCSTTFEMGVDVGTLETVFMRNMPPSPSNYAQRAGRAGRSKHSAAYALTFCNKSNHDFIFFKTPEKMIHGRINPPKFNIENDKIAIRHLYASALSMFWKQHREYFSKTVNMIDEINGTESGIDAFESYLRNKPKDLEEFLLRFLPSVLSKKYSVETFGWLDSLLKDDTEEPGLFKKAIAEYRYEIEILKNDLEMAKKEAKYSQCKFLQERIDLYEKEEILAFLSRKNILPKYGFPVDTVELTVLGQTGKNNMGLQLQRDLSIAISEYAPGSQIVANGNLITSRYIRKLPNMSWKLYDYIYCEECKTLNLEPHQEFGLNPLLYECVQCRTTLNPHNIQTFLIPSFGFESDLKIEKPGLIKPEKTYKGEIAYVGNRSMENAHKFKIGRSDVDLQMNKGDEMAVINQSNFFVCESCGYTELEHKSGFYPTKKQNHKSPSGYPCKNDGTNILKKYSLGYRFETDVVHIRFSQWELEDWEKAISVLYGMLRGICSILNIEQSDISGCLHYFRNSITGKGNYGLIFYDTTPGGAGHVRRLENRDILEKVIDETIRIMSNCNCGGEKKDSSCYTCLRSYYNQKYHDVLQRKHVINYLNSLKESLAETKRLYANYNKDGVDLSEMIISEIWSYAKPDPIDEEEEIIFEKLIDASMEKPVEKPKYGGSITIVDTDETITTDLLWPKSKVLFFVKYNDDEFSRAQKTDWRCYCTSKEFDINEFITAIRSD